MNYTLGFVPYLNMVPFHRGFGPADLRLGSDTLSFKTLSPRGLGLECEKGTVIGGAVSLVDSFRLASHLEPLGDFGIGVKKAANSVLLFSKRYPSEIEGVCSVTDETSTSAILLKLILESRFSNKRVLFGRIASARLFDGDSEGLLLIGDEALHAAKVGIKGLTHVTDLGAEWFAWQGLSFAFARWMIRKDIPIRIKTSLMKHIESSLISTERNIDTIASDEATHRPFSGEEIKQYWQGFDYRLSAPHFESILRFQALTSPCLTP